MNSNLCNNLQYVWNRLKLSGDTGAARNVGMRGKKRRTGLKRSRVAAACLGKRAHTSLGWGGGGAGCRT